MNTNDTRNRIADLQRQLDSEKASLQRVESTCRHNWGPVVADHIFYKGYTIEGDPVGTCGVDWRGPVYVPSREDKRWKRTCTICGKSEFTTATNKRTVEEPKFY